MTLKRVRNIVVVKTVVVIDDRKRWVDRVKLYNLSSAPLDTSNIDTKYSDHPVCK